MDAMTSQQADWLRRFLLELEAEEWEIQLRPRVGLVEPDLIAWNRNHTAAVIIELKAGRQPVHTGILGQLNIFAAELAKEFPRVAVKSALVTNSPVDRSLRSLAGEFGIHILQTASAPSAAARQLDKFLRTTGPGSIEP